ncbi:hypothetical protein ACFE04_014715 [Oxalis oulophora]
MIQKNKQNVTFQGQGFTSTAIVWNDTANSSRGTFYSGSVQVFSDRFVAKNISFMNVAPLPSPGDNCQLVSIANPVPPGVKTINGAVTAHGRVSKDENTGFAFVNCTVGGTGRIWLGRAWRPASRVIFASSTMSDIIAAEGWNDFNDPSRDQTIFYGEYNCSGPGANMSMRAPYVQRLNDTQVSAFISLSYVDADQWLLNSIF